MGQQKTPQKGRFWTERWAGWRIAQVLHEFASQNAFSIPASQKVADRRVSSGAEVKPFKFSTL
jgi:hypothetical protein